MAERPTDHAEPVGELPNGDILWPGPSYLIRIHGDPERYVDSDIVEVIENHYNVLARLESGPLERVAAASRALEDAKSERSLAWLAAREAGCTDIAIAAAAGVTHAAIYNALGPRA